MFTIFRTALLCLAAALAGGSAFAADDQPLMAKPGKVLFEDDFARSELGPKWKVAKGTWAIQDSAVSATENPADNHAAVAKTNFAYKDIVAEFSFKFTGSPRFNVVMDDNTYKGSHGGHIARVTIAPATVQLGDSKTGAMRNDLHEKLTDPKTTPQEKKQIQESIKDTVATFKCSLDAAQVHHARVEIVGDEMLVSIDGKPAGYLKSEGIGHPTKNLFGFAVSGKSMVLDDVKVCEAEASADWPARRAEVTASLHK